MTGSRAYMVTGRYAIEAVAPVLFVTKSALRDASRLIQKTGGERSVKSMRLRKVEQIVVNAICWKNTA